MNQPVSDLRYLRGIGPKRAQALAKLGIRTLRDLLFHFPSRHEDRSQFMHVADLQPGQLATLQLEILDAKLKPIPRLPRVEVVAGDETGAITAVWYRQTYLLKQFLPGRKIMIYGKADLDGKKMKFSSPEFELLDEAGPSIHTGRIVPIYPLTEGIYQKSLRALMYSINQSSLSSDWPDVLPPAIRSQENLITLSEALRGIHFPETGEQLEIAKRRLIFDEFFSFQLALQAEIRKNRARRDGIALDFNSQLIPEFAAALPFELTAGQAQAVHEIAEDLRRARPMHRLLQGDVGSGKTVVAAFAFRAVQAAGWQSALLIPTEILAEQHYRTVSALLAPFKTRVALLTKSTEKKRREKLLAELKQGKIDLLIGTHAILQNEIVWSKLGLVVIDEQHKFGVEQRGRLLERKPKPHFLIMTATPIPRSLALAIYADADFSTIRELPRGRKPIQTYWISRNKQPEVWEHIREKLREGRQAYVVFPIIEESAQADLKAAETEFKRLKEIFTGFKIALVHGKTPASQREQAMRLFAAGDIHLLVSTTIIEVGVDQPNATVMVIENAERFGLAQLHQLRGRIGRGEHASECFLFGEPHTDDGKTRLRLLTKTQDGFQIAEEDLNLRGPGDLWGERQSGVPHFRLAHPVWNADLLQAAKKLAETLVETEPDAPWLKKYLAETLRSY